MTVRVGVLGAGTVGGALVNRLLADRDAIRLKSGSTSKSDVSR